MVGSLSPAERTVVAILRALRQLGQGSRGKVIILDEPTAALPRGEAARLLELLKVMARNGTAVLYISHHMHEVLSVCDQVSVLRNGRIVGTKDCRATTESEIVEMMLGYELEDFYPDKHESANETVRLEVRSLTHGLVSNLAFKVHQGEIVGVTGLAGMGQDDVPYLLAGGGRVLRIKCSWTEALSTALLSPRISEVCTWCLGTVFAMRCGSAVPLQRT